MKRALLATIVLLTSPALIAQKTVSDGIKELATQISTSAAKQEKQRIAVIPFHELEGQPTIFGTYIAEELVTNLFQLGNFKIVERQLLDKVLGELKVEQTGAIDPATAKQVGKIAGVDAIVTGSITDLNTMVAVNCRLIDTTTGEVFAAAKTMIAKDDDVAKIMTTVLTPGEAGARPSYQAAHAIATKDLDLLRVVLTSVVAMEGGLRWTFSFMNRDARTPLVVAMNAETSAPAEGVRFTPASTRLRASVVDEHGGEWTLSSAGLGSIGFVHAGVHGRNGQYAYSPTEIAKLLRLRDTLGRDYDDPTDGVTMKADSVGEGGANVTFNSAVGITSPERFFPFRGNIFISGATTTIPPGQNLTVTMTFHPEGYAAVTHLPSWFQFQSEIIVGTTGRKYALHNLTFDRVSVARAP
jgi:curli biogenesis system outer membrane secretion channel CsgG